MASSSSSHPYDGSGIFITRCCRRPICPACISSNPRLARYDPCLACFGGAGTTARSGGRSSVAPEIASAAPRNLDGAVRDEDTYVIGDDDEDEDEPAGLHPSTEGPPPYSASAVDSFTPAPDAPPTPSSSALESPALEGDASTQVSQVEYYIKSDDTLKGIALRFGVNGHELCRLNNLPPSTLSTTPHILHTRNVIILPASRKLLAQKGALSQGDNQERESRRARERAEKRLQTLTKEVDWRVAKAYVALADDPEDVLGHYAKFKEDAVPTKGVRTDVESRALDRYLDDAEWEESERRAGRSAIIPTFPYFSSQSSSAKKRGDAAGGGSKLLRRA
ncbi:hypothetical protein PLICRDRAFT_108749 [Plicaturopsis crispa FD-325 SS-3]|nr:hypothetical protein PLICRDRAFT_108749 [Plicaturopsis crispa FD-325 SS-3]